MPTPIPISLTSVIGHRPDSVEVSLRRYFGRRSQELHSVELSTNHGDLRIHGEIRRSLSDLLILAADGAGTTVVYPRECLAWDEVAEYLSRALRASVLALQMLDKSLWMYLLFVDGELVDRFNPIPCYWEELPRSEQAEWRGRVELLAEWIPGLRPERVARYLANWEDVPGGRRGKAYADDEFRYGDAWQLLDFMRGVGLGYPIDQAGRPLGPAYRVR